MSRIPDPSLNDFSRWSDLEDRKEAVGSDLLEFFAGMRQRGFNTKALRAAFQIKREMQSDPVELQSLNDDVQRYLVAIGVTADVASRAARQAPARESIYADKNHEPTIRERLRTIRLRDEARKRGELPPDVVT